MNMNDLRWIIRTDQPFTGISQSVLLPDDTVAYTGGMTLEEYKAERGFPVRVVGNAEFDAMLDRFYASCITDPKPITEGEFWEALECLPPCKWGHHKGVEMFHVSERLQGDLVSWYAKHNGKHYTMTHEATADPDVLADAVRAA